VTPAVVADHVDGVARADTLVLAMTKKMPHRTKLSGEESLDEAARH
jgi:hypothetical protein